MSKLSGNKGEWSEVYVFLKLLAAQKLYAADKNLNRIEGSFFDILKIIRTESFGKLEFRIDKTANVITVVDAKTKNEMLSLPCDKFKQEATYLYNELCSASTRSFEVPHTENFLNNLKVNTLKAKSTDKSDIQIQLHDIDTGYETIQGFSIKSRLGQPSTLVNAGKTTNFIYEITGDVDDNIMNIFNSKKKFKDKFEFLSEKNCNVEYSTMNNTIFRNNLLLIDGDLPKICASMLKMFYTKGISTISNSLEQLNQINPNHYDLSSGHPFYEYKFKKFLVDSALGMTPSSIWNGIADATGGYIIVKENGDIVCYHLYNRNEFESYLVQNTKFETPSTSRHDFGYIYKENNKYYLKLNLQIRFIK